MDTVATKPMMVTKEVGHDLEATEADAARVAFERTWGKRCPGVVTSLRRRVKTQGSLPSALVLLFSLVASGQIRLRKIDGWRKIAAVLRKHQEVAA